MSRALAALKSRLRRDGRDMLAMSVVVIVLTLGLSLLWELGRVYRLARTCPSSVCAHDLLVVLGAPLQADRVTPMYGQRLLRAHALIEAGLAQRILILGGHTYGHTRSEAAGGRAFLVERGVSAERIVIEERSHNTMENLRNARERIEDIRHQAFILVTSRCHLTRGVAVARAFGLRPVPCAAEPALRHDAPTAWWLLREALGLHWYELDLWWSRWSGNAERLQRIT